MIRIINILTIGFILTLVSCGQTTSKNSIEKVVIKFDEIVKIEIKNNPHGQSKERMELKELKIEQGKILVNSWNNSEFIGPCKFKLQYWLFVTFKNGTIRTFRVNGQNMKENNDWCYNIGKELFFEKLFINANPIPDEKEKTFEQMQGFWVHDKDSLASLTINNYKWTFNYVGVQTDFDDNYSISLTNKLPEFVDETVKAEFIILSNKTDTLQYEILGLTDSTFSMMYFPAGKIHLYRREK